MIFIPILIYAIIEFFRDRKVWSILIFFFFLTDGFQLIPSVLFDTHFGINKSLDFAVLYLLAVSGGLFISTKGKAFQILNDKVMKSLVAFLCFYILIVAVNISIYHVPFSSVLRNSRSFLLLLTFFVFYDLTVDDIDRIKRKLFVLSIFLSFIFIVQVLSGIQLLTGYVGGTMELAGMTFRRFYNIPVLTFYFLFYSIFTNPYTGAKKTVSQIIIITSFLLPMHRGFIASFLVLLLLGFYFTQRSTSKFMRSVIVLGFLLLPFSPFIIDRFSSGAGGGIDEILTNGIDAYDMQISETQTMYYRFAHTIERAITVAGEKIYSVFGIGLWVDEDPVARNKFDFMVGTIINENYEEPIIFFTNDIAWSVFFMRLGFVGTLFYLFFYANWMLFFYKRRKNDLCVVNFLLLLLFILTSISSVEIVTIWATLLSVMDYVKVKKSEPEQSLMNPEGIPEVVNKL